MPVNTVAEQLGFLKKQLFRFCFLYFTLYISLFVAGSLLTPFVYWLAGILHVTTPIHTEGYGSGDTIYNYLEVCSLLLFAGLGSILWAIADRKSVNYIRLQYWFHVLLRYTLAFFMLDYGFGKIYESQFPAPFIDRLLLPYGDSSPMGLAWTFIGASRPFSIFTGIAEALGGMLLLFRRTTILGCMLCITVLSNIVAMNFCYDIPVKLFSSHLLLMSLIILSPDIPRLIRFFLFNEANPSTRYYPLVRAQWVKVTYIIIKLLVIALVLAPHLYTMFDSSESYSEEQAKAPLYGIYDVPLFVKENDTLPPLLTDNFRWKQFVVSGTQRSRVYKMSDSAIRYGIEVQTKENKLLLKSEDTTETFTYSYLPDSTLQLKGIWQGHRVNMLLKRRDHKQYLLINRGFHWVNERPFNR